MWWERALMLPLHKTELDKTRLWLLPANHALLFYWLLSVKVQSGKGEPHPQLRAMGASTC